MDSDKRGFSSLLQAFSFVPANVPFFLPHYIINKILIAANFHQPDMSAAGPESPQQAVEGQDLLSVEVQFPQDGGRNVKPLSVKMAGTDTISDLALTLAMVVLMANLTSYSLYSGSTNISDTCDDLSPISEVFEALNLDLSRPVQLVLRHKPYNLAAVYRHLNKFREVIGLHLLDRRAFEAGEMGGAGKFDQLGLEAQAGEQASEKDGEEKEPELTKEERESVSAVCDRMLGENQSSLLQYGRFSDVLSELQLPLKSLALLPWAPVTPQDAARGDLLYLTILTLENDTFHITCHVSGFFVNCSSGVNFNPVRKPGYESAFVFYDLVSALSPGFAKAIVRNQETLAGSSAYAESYLIPSVGCGSFPWIVDPKSTSRKPDQSRPQIPVLTGGVDGCSNVKDWNQDFQAIRELPSSSVDERILRDRLAVQLLSEFSNLATETAMNIVKGNIPAMNPNELIEDHFYVRNGIFYSLGVNSTGAFDETGGNEAARYAASKDVAAVRLLNRIDAKGIYHLATCVVDYMGRRIVCQAPVPGILNEPVGELRGDEEVKEATQIPELPDKVCYGLLSDRTQVYTDQEFCQSLKPIADAFHIKPHKAVLPNGFSAKEELVLSKESKGIKGTDGRNYVIDLYRTTPLDIEFIEAHWQPESSASYPHREAVLRHEAVEEWWRRRALAIFQKETEKMEKENAGSEEAKNDGTETSEQKPQILLDGQKVLFNPDAFSGDQVDPEELQVVREMSQFVGKQLMDEFVDECKKQLCPFDGAHLSSLLHKTGINLRYLGTVAEKVKEAAEEHESEERRVVEENERAIEEEKKLKEEPKEEPKEENEAKNEKDEKDAKDEAADKLLPSNGVFDPIGANLNSIYRLSIQEMIARSVKHILRRYACVVPCYLFSHLVSHFHNCLLGAEIVLSPTVEIDETLKAFVSSEVLEFTRLDCEQVGALVEKEVFSRFRFTLPAEWRLIVGPVALMREIAHKFGIQWKALDYGFDQESFAKLQNSTAKTALKPAKKLKKKAVSPESITAVRSTVFVPEDVVCFIPTTKSATYKATLMDEIFAAAREKIAADDKDTGITLLNELVSIYEQIYGPVHPETSNFYSILSQFYSDLGYAREASEVAKKACVLFERSMGFDSFGTISSYINAAYYEAASQSYVNAFRLYEKALGDWDHVFGNHPSAVTTLTNLAEILSQLKVVDQANRFFSAALLLSYKTNGADSQISAMIHYRFAGTLVSANRFDESLSHFESAHKVFSRHIGPQDRLSTDCANYVANLKTYIAYLKQQEKEKKQPKKVNAPPAVPHTKKGKKNGQLQPDPEIASKSVDEILRFIEGKGGKKKGKK